ncbi:MAG: hypothetical protein NDF55_08920 [archaeon GB-1867-005]|nr:hypothetical protein [Candidatus Culexmicrobium cathedralense]
MKITIICKEYEEIILPRPLYLIVYALSRRKHGIHVLNPKLALLILFKAVKEVEKKRKQFTKMIPFYQKPLVVSDILESIEDEDLKQDVKDFLLNYMRTSIIYLDRYITVQDADILSDILTKYSQKYIELLIIREA